MYKKKMSESFVASALKAGEPARNLSANLENDQCMVRARGAHCGGIEKLVGEEMVVE